MPMRVCVFCGSSPGRVPAYREAAAAFGGVLAREGVGLVFGGGAVGLMGVVADAARAEGGEVIGVIPEALATREIAHYGLTELRVVGSMHERKALMAELSDAFVALPGGIGTLEELFEVWTWGQLGLHAKPVALLDVDDFYAPMIRFLDGMVHEGFLRAPHRALLHVARDPVALLAHLRTCRPSPQPKLIDHDET
ncbi:MAG: TIGR00730 family Rossman fold protein [Polyangiales bacterium]